MKSPGFGETRIVADINKPRLNGEALATLYRRYSGRRVIVSTAAEILGSALHLGFHLICKESFSRKRVCMNRQFMVSSSE